MSKNSTRQSVRKALIIISFLFFPITMNYLSPYVIIDGASQGVINGSFVMFGVLFLSALVVGRAWCAWVCPAGGLNEIAFAVNNRPANIKKLDKVKWFIWVIWLGVIVVSVIAAGGYHAFDFFLDTQGGISVAGAADRPIIFAYAIYYLVVGVFMIFSLATGRRGGCHTICWMAPFMILGRKRRNQLGWAALRLKANASACTDCKTCTRGCPMSLDVNALVHSPSMEHSECILCGTCVDHCPASVIRYSFSRGKGN